MRAEFEWRALGRGCLALVPVEDVFDLGLPVMRRYDKIYGFFSRLNFTLFLSDAGIDYVYGSAEEAVARLCQVRGYSSVPPLPRRIRTVSCLLRGEGVFLCRPPLCDTQKHKSVAFRLVEEIV